MQGLKCKNCMHQKKSDLLYDHFYNKNILFKITYRMSLCSGPWMCSQVRAETMSGWEKRAGCLGCSSLHVWRCFGTLGKPEMWNFTQCFSLNGQIYIDIVTDTEIEIDICPLTGLCLLHSDQCQTRLNYVVTPLFLTIQGNQPYF